VVLLQCDHDHVHRNPPHDRHDPSADLDGAAPSVGAGEAVGVPRRDRGDAGRRVRAPGPAVAHRVAFTNPAQSDHAGAERRHGSGCRATSASAVEEDARPDQVGGVSRPAERGRAVGRVHQGRTARKGREDLLESGPLELGRDPVHLGRMEMRERAFPALSRAEPLRHGVAERRVVVPESRAGHAGVDLDMERLRGARGPGLEGSEVTQGRAHVEFQATVDPLREKGRTKEDRTADAGASELRTFFDRGDPVAPGRERLQCPRDRDRAQPVAVSFDHG